MTDDDAGGATPDLSLVATEDLIAELKRRYDGLVLVTERDATGNESCVIIDYHGGLSRCIGLADRGRRVMLDDAVTGTDKTDPTEGREDE